jgi:hypothetical protein
VYRINLQEFNEKSLKSQLKQQRNDYKQESRVNEQTVSELHMKMQRVTQDKDKMIDKLRDQIDEWVDKYNNEITEIKGTTDDGLDKVKEEYESKLNDIKYLNEQEKISLRSQIRKLEEEVMLLREQDNSFDFNRDSEFETDKVKVLDIRLSEINDKFTDDMLANEKHISRLKRENDEMSSKITTLKVGNEKLKDFMNTKFEEKDKKYAKLKEKLNDKTSELQGAQRKVKESLNLKKRYSDLKLKISKQEAIIRDLKESLKASNNELDAERAEQQKTIIAERRKNRVKGSKMSKMKREMDLKSIELESLKKENQEVSMMSESRYYSPRVARNIRQDDDVLSSDPRTAYTSGRVRLDSPTNYSNINESVSYIKKTRRMKSSSPDRTNGIMSAQKIRVGGLGRDRSSRRLIQISTDQTNMYDDSNSH